MEEIENVEGEVEGKKGWDMKPTSMLSHLQS